MQGVLEKGQDVVLRLDVQGAATIRKLIPDCISIFIVRETPLRCPPLPTTAQGTSAEQRVVPAGG